MDPAGFDRVARAFATAGNRRRVLRAGGGAVLAVVLALLRPGASSAQPVGIESTCRGLGEVCKQDGQCCSTRCHQGRCDCLRRGARCSADRACCSGRCRNTGKCA